MDYARRCAWNSTWSDRAGRPIKSNRTWLEKSFLTPSFSHFSHAQSTVAGRSNSAAGETLSNTLVYCGFDGGDGGGASKSGGSAMCAAPAAGTCVGESASSAPASAPAGLAAPAGGRSGLCAARWTIRVRAWQKPLPHVSQRNGFSFEWMYLRRRAENRSLECSVHYSTVQ